jgi:hypothetical protein
MSTYIPPDPAVVEAVHRRNRDSREQYQRLKDAPVSLLRRILIDRAAPTEARGNALGILLQRKDAAVPELLPELFEDPELGHQAIRHCPLTDAGFAAFPGCQRDPKVVERVRGLLDHARDRIWSCAALALARAKDETLRPRLLNWFHKGDQGHRNVAIEALIELDAAEAAGVFRESWQSGGRDDEDRLVLAGALLRLGDTRALDFLEAATQRAEGAWAVFAATSITEYDAVWGFRLMQWILDHGDSESLSSLVMHAWNMAHLPHAFTADGIHETRLWVEHLLQEHETGGKSWATPYLKN